MGLGPAGGSVNAHLTSLALRTHSLPSPYDAGSFFREPGAGGEGGGVVGVRGVIVDERGAFLSSPPKGAGGGGDEEPDSPWSAAWKGRADVYETKPNSDKFEAFRSGYGAGAKATR